MQMQINKQIKINGVDFTINQLTNMFPKSFFTGLLKNHTFKEGINETQEITIVFPESVDPRKENAKKYMQIIADRIEYGDYLEPRVAEDLNDYRFRSILEMDTVLEYLSVNDNEINLLQEDPTNEFDYEDENLDENLDYKYGKNFLDEDLLGAYEDEKEDARKYADDESDNWEKGYTNYGIYHNEM